MATKKKAAKAVIQRDKKPVPSVIELVMKKAGAVPPRPRAAITPELYREVEQLLYQQSELLDMKRWAAYVDLFTADGVYWAPSLPEHEHWDGKPAIFIEDKDLMTVRVKRVTHPNAWSQQAEWATSHVVSNIAIEGLDKDGCLIVRSRFHMMEMRRDDIRHFGGTYRHSLKRTKDGLRIKLQRVDLFNAQAAYEYVLQVWV
jgi:3-phenylpropionate/cinnamic acid dioxygenase small subunit